jgi:hypothetical protein
MNLTTTQITQAGLGIALCFAAYKLIDHPAIKTGAIAIAAVIAARKAPILSRALAV